MKKLLLAISLLTLATSSTAFAEPPSDAKEISKHLEFLGYTVSMGADTLDAQHENFLNISIEQYQGGLLLAAYFRGTDHAHKNPHDFLALINSLNQKASAARYYMDKDGDLILEGYFPGGYDKKTFNTFLDVFNMERLNLGDVSAEVQKFVE